MELVELQYYNHSGGANGADTCWAEYGAQYNIITNAYYYGTVTPTGNFPISYSQYMDGLAKYREAAKLMKRNVSHSKYVLALVSRNWQQVINSEAVFAIANIEGRYVKGGTGYAVAMAEIINIPVYVFDERRNCWYRKESTMWRKIKSPILTINFAGIGSRDIGDLGKAAIQTLYKETFGY